MAMEMQSIRISIPGFILAQEDALIVDMTLYCTRPKTPLKTPIVSEDGNTAPTVQGDEKQRKKKLKMSKPPP